MCDRRSRAYTTIGCGASVLWRAGQAAGRVTGSRHPPRVSEASCAPAAPSHYLYRYDCSTPQYQAPEILAADVATVGYTRAVDWWAFGCLMVRGGCGGCGLSENDCTRFSPSFALTLYASFSAPATFPNLCCLQFEMMTGHAAFGAAETPVAEVHAKVLSPKGGPSIPGSLPRAARDLIAGLLTRDPAKRISTAAAVKAHPFFARVDWEAVRTKR
jgi:serine/threonine protein kinase